MNPTLARLSRRALPASLAAALAASVLAGCSGTDRNAAGPAPAGTAASPSAAPSAAPAPTARPTGEADPALKDFYTQRITWAPCADLPGTDKVDESKVQCATLKVPLDYTNPGADTVDVALSRIPALHQDRRVGSLLVNPGGPGGSGVDTVVYGQGDFDGGLHDRFDIVGFDPRGAGGTLPVLCLDGKDRDAWLTSDDPGEDHGKVLAEACRAKYAKVLPFLGTRDTVRDMDVLRGALGDRKLHYLGLSYGTYIGSVYAEEFPDRVGRLVLDGATDRATDLLRQNIEQQAGFERSLRLFAEDCARKPADCPLGSDPATAPQKLADFLDGLKQKPLTTGDGRRLTSAAAWTGVANLLYGGDEKSSTDLRNRLGWAMVRGKGDHLLAAADRYNGRGEDGKYSPSADAYTAIHCADAPQAPTEDELRALLGDLAGKAPLMSRHAPLQALFDPDCRSWPFRSPEKPHRIRNNGAAPIVVVGSTGDPATPYAWSEKLTESLGQAVLLTREGEGHVAYWRSSCVRDKVNAFLVDGTVPAAGTRCATG